MCYYLYVDDFRSGDGDVGLCVFGCDLFGGVWWFCIEWVGGMDWRCGVESDYDCFVWCGN